MRCQIALKTGFTLIELLVVTGIFAFLASLLLTAVRLAIGKAGRVTCMNNLRQIHLGVRRYAADSNDKSPGQAAETGKTYVLDDYKGPYEKPCRFAGRLFGARQVVCLSAGRLRLSMERGLIAQNPGPPPDNFLESHFQ